MSKRYTLKEHKLMLHAVLSNALTHMYIIEKQIGELKLKLDGTDAPEDLKKAQIYTLVLTLLNDTIHCCHGYLRTIQDEKMIDRFIENQKKAFENKLVNPCTCSDCKQRGYKYHDVEMAMERTKDSRECAEDSGELKN